MYGCEFGIYLNVDISLLLSTTSKYSSSPINITIHYTDVMCSRSGCFLRLRDDLASHFHQGNKGEEDFPPMRNETPSILADAASAASIINNEKTSVMK